MENQGSEQRSQDPRQASAREHGLKGQHETTAGTRIGHQRREGQATTVASPPPGEPGNFQDQNSEHQIDDST